MSEGLLSLNWNNHGATFSHTLAGLRGKDKYSDVTVSCGGKFYQSHKLVLSTCSEYFEKVFENTSCKHPVIVLGDVKCKELESLLSYMYNGVVSVAQNDLARLIKVAELLQIKGLAVPDEPPDTKPSSNKRGAGDASPSTSRSSSPKRRRRQESGGDQPSASGTSSVPQHRSQEPQGSSSRLENQDSRFAEDRLQDTAQDSVHSPLMVNVDESVVKEEILDDDDDDPVPFVPSVEMSESVDTPQDGIGLAIPKFDEGDDIDQKHLEEGQFHSAMDALAGPSGLQGMANEGDMASRMALGEGFASGESHDMSSSPLVLPLQASAESQQMAFLEGVEHHHFLESDDFDDGQNHDEKTSKKHPCPFCTYSANQGSDLKRHIRLHTGEKPFSCPQCPFTTAQSGALTRHLRTHTGEKPYSCSMCSFTCSQNGDLHKHLLTHTGERPFTCSFCSAGFISNSKLISHERIHTGDKPFACPLCDYRSTRKDNLKSHIRRYHKLL